MKLDFRNNLNFGYNSISGRQDFYKFVNGRGASVMLRKNFNGYKADHYEVKHIFYSGRKVRHHMAYTAVDEWGIIGLETNIFDNIVDVYNTLQKIEEWSIDDMNTLLTVEDYRYLKEMQSVLDDNILLNHNISEKQWIYDLNKKHMIALKNEVAEVVKEAEWFWKYWKQKRKPINGDLLLEEAIDVLHFIILIENKKEVKAEELVKLQDSVDEKDVESYLFDLSTSNNMYVLLGSLLALLHHLNFNREDIMRAYKAKNKVNHMRVSEGY